MNRLGYVEGGALMCQAIDKTKMGEACAAYLIYIGQSDSLAQTE